MWPLIIGAVSQATDPAKKLADDYCAYVISQGAQVDYATIYNIYKNEYLTDPDKGNLTDWYDIRAGKKGNPVDFLYSLIPPYRIAPYISRFYIENNEYAVAGNHYYPLSHYNDANIGIKTVTKINILPLSAHRYTNTVYSTSGLVYIGLRLLNYSGSAAFASYLNTPQGSLTQNTYTLGLPFLSGINIIESSIDFHNTKLHRAITKDGEVSVSTEGKSAYEIASTGTAQARISAASDCHFYWTKHYKIL